MTVALKRVNNVDKSCILYDRVSHNLTITRQDYIFTRIRKARIVKNGTSRKTKKRYSKKTY
jgi:hypothetical protein